MNFESVAHQKNTYRFNEISTIAGVKPYVLRFWESEFEIIGELEPRTRQRVYLQKDLEHVRRIKNLLFKDKMSIEEVKQLFSTEGKLKEQLEKVEVPRDMISKQLESESSIEAITLHKSSLEMMKSALARDFAEKGSLENEVDSSQEKQKDQDILNLIHAKKKLTLVLSRMNSMIKKRNYKL